MIVKEANVNFFIEEGHGVNSGIATKILYSLMKQKSIEAFICRTIASLQRPEAAWSECCSFDDRRNRTIIYPFQHFGHISGELSFNGRTIQLSQNATPVPAFQLIEYPSNI
jgi:hypothetical protein